jgi:uncharacterized membrane protein HdeD (DUF308 family)
MAEAINTPRDHSNQKETPMATATGHPAFDSFGLQELRKNWRGFLALGIALLVLGTIALGSSIGTTIVSMVLFGWLLIIGGILEAIHAFAREKGWGGFFIDLLGGILYAVVGFMMVANPAATAVTLTLLMALSLMFGGIFRVVVALMHRFPHWGWLALHGVINVLLGIAIWRQWPWDGLWVIGLVIGIDLIFNGWSLIMLGLAAKRLPASEQAV